MKILHVIPSVAAVRGGPSQAVIEMVRAIRDRSIEAEIVTTNDNGNDLLDVPLGKCVNYRQVPIYFFSRFSPNCPPIREFAFSRQLTSWLWKNIHNYDLLHVHAIFSYPSTVAMAIARIKKVPYIVRPLGQLCEWSLQQSPKKKQIYLKIVEKANLDRAQAFHFTSKQEQQEASQLSLNTPHFILPHGLFIPSIIPDARQRLRQQLNLPSDEPIILFLSRLHPKKGLDRLIPALGRLSRTRRFTFVIAGNGTPDYEEAVKSLIDSSGIKNHTHFVGFVKGEFKDLLIQGADIFALTSYSENFGIAVLEALAAGLPVLITPGVALADFVQEKNIGYITSPDLEAISSILQRVLENPKELKSMSKHSRKIISEYYTWNHIANNLDKRYSQIIMETVLTRQ